MQTGNVRNRVFLLAAVFVCAVWGYKSLIFTHAPQVFSDPKEDMSFAWYVPLFSLYVVYREWNKIKSTVSHASWCGLAATVLSLFVGFLGVRGIQIRFEMLSFIALLVCVPWAFFGWNTAKSLMFPAGYLLFCIPLSSFLDVITVHLRLLATAIAANVLHGMNAAVVRTGTMLAAADGSFAIDVAEPCSGLRSIFALMALTAGYAYFSQRTWARRALLFACSVPLAIIGNVIRVLSICAVASFSSPGFASGFYHDYSGYVVFFVAIVLMAGLGELIARWGRK